MDSELWKYPARNEGARDSHDEIAKQAQTCAFDNLAGEPASRDADSQYDDQTIARYVHFCALTIGQFRR